MMQTKLVFKLIIFLLLVHQAQGQDLNQTNYRYAPLYKNPALSGHFLGSARILASYRDQGRELMFDEYRTMQFFADMPIAGSFKENDWSGLGIGFYSDQAGKIPVSTQGIFLNGAYHLALDKKRMRILSAGIQYGVVQRSLEGDQIIFESDHIDPGVTLTDRSNFASYSSQYHDLNAGINFTARNKKGDRFDIGFSAYHLIQTDIRFMIDQNFYDRRYSAYSSYFFGLSKQFFLQPEITASISENASNIMPQIKAFFKLSKDKKKTDMLYFGTGYRIGDALQLMFGLNFKKWDVGIAYDVTVSSASEYNNGRGGFEIGVFRIIEIPQKPTVIPSLICPRM